MIYSDPGVDQMSRAIKTKEERLDLRLRAEDKQLLEKAAEIQGLSLSSYVITRSLSAAREDSAPYKTYALSDKDFALFTRLLENPPAPNARLKKAVKRYHRVVAT